MLSNIFNKVDLKYGELISKKHIYWLILIYVLITLPMLNIFPIWLPAIVFCAVAIKLFNMKTRTNPSKIIALTFTLIVLFGVIMNFRVFGKEYTGIALLYGFSAIKLLEVNKERDAYLFMLINIMLIMGSLMAVQNPLVFIYLMGGFFANVYLQIAISQDEKLNLNWRNNAKTIIKIALISLPFVILLFFFFPRLNPLWGVPNQPKLQTGFSDEMTANSLSTLSQSDALAFRVKFKTSRPNNSQLYWRGPVLSNFDGKTWRRNPTVAKHPLPISVNEKSKVSYSMTVDGATQDWVLPIDIPGIQPNNATINAEFETKANKPISEPQVFDFDSFTSYTNYKFTNHDQIIYTKLPKDIFPKTRELAKELFIKSNSDTQKFIALTLQYFATQDFKYDLEPPVGNDDLDVFLFKNKVGYCEHYASSFAFMLRSVRIPARIIVGYQGGEQNSISKEWEVRQLDAHAWTEVYVNKEKGWVRVDPTSAVAPNRINSGNPFNGVGNTDALSIQSRLKQQSVIAKNLFNIISASNALWQNWVIGFNQDKQNALWEKLGLKYLGNYIWIIGFIVFSAIALILVFVLKKSRQIKADELEITMLYFLDALTLFDITRDKYQPLSEVCQKADFGTANPLAENIVSEYNKLRYEKPDTDNTKLAITKLRKQIDVFVEQARQINRYKLK